MLVLSRKAGQQLVIGDNVTVVVQRISGNRVTLAIEAPRDVRIVRGELKRFTDEFGQPQREREGPMTLTFGDESSGSDVPHNAR